MADIIKFENFIYGCNNVLDNSSFDLIEKPNSQSTNNYEVKMWETKSFYATNRMKTCSKVWREDKNDIITNSHSCKSKIKYLYLIDGNQKVIHYIKKELCKIINRIEKFREKFNLNHVDKMPKNQWFFEMKSLIYEFKYWLEEITTDVSDQKINNKLEKPNSLSHVEISKFPAVFNEKGYELFNHLMENFITKERGFIADITYYYWQMVEDKFIHAKSTPFINWFNKEYPSNTIDLIKSKHESNRSQNANISRQRNYTTAKEWLNKLKSKSS